MKLISRPLTAMLAIAGAAILLPPVALASTSGSAAPRQAAVTVPACGNAHPAAHDGAFVWASLPADGFAGGIGYIMEITNESRHTCTLRGVPGGAVENGGHLIGSKIPAVIKGQLVTLKPGATAFFTLEVHAGGAVCAHPVGGEVIIYLPGQRQAQMGWIGAQACPGRPGGGVLDPGPIQPGTGIPFYNV